MLIPYQSQNGWKHSLFSPLFHHVGTVIFAGGNVSLQANDSFFSNNSAHAGGALLVWEGKVGMANTTINNCSALSAGGGGVAVVTELNISRAAQVTLHNCNISDCRAKKEVSKTTPIA